VLKQPTENKSRGDIFTSSLYGVTVRRQDIEDPRRPGHLREGGLFGPAEWDAARYFGLRTVTGKSLELTEPAPDLREPTRGEAPRELLDAAEAARAALDDCQARLRGALAARASAEAEASGIESRAYRRDVLPGDEDAHATATARARAAGFKYDELLHEEAVARRRVSVAEAALTNWIWDERQRRHAKQ
jgi:hypothetical protein